MFRLLKIGFALLLFFFLTASPASAQYIGSCPDENEIKADPAGWLGDQKAFQTQPPPVYDFYDPYLNNNFPQTAHLDTAPPNPDNLGCLITYAQAEWYDNYGTNFNNNNVEKVIQFAIANSYNPALLLALWSEESHGGDQSAIEMGCGSGGGLDAQLRCLAGIDPKYKNNTFACFLGSYAGDTPSSLNCGYGDPDGAVTNPDFPYMIQFYNYLHEGVQYGQASPPPITPTTFKDHPLRPFPDEAQTTDKLTTYCAMRPTPVEINTFDKRLPTIDPQTVGTLTQDFSKFITPLLSITDPKKADYLLPFNQKAQRYLLDYLEGRAYYEPQPEPVNPSFQEQMDLFNRLGVFRKLAPATYQDGLKRAIILRANQKFDGNYNPYGFEPASSSINNYIVGSWQGQPVTLKDYYASGAWAPLPQDYSVDTGATYTADSPTYIMDYADWKLKDGGKWYKLWPYVPMFTREDTKGTIGVIDSNGNPWSPSGQAIEENQSEHSSVDVSHPHLARAYEVTTSLSFLLTPEQSHQPDQLPFLGEEWIPKLWEDSIWWLDPSYKRPNPEDYGLEMGPLCDVDPTLINLISSSGDPALDSKIETDVWRSDLFVPNPEWVGPPSKQTADCGLIYECEECVSYTCPDGSDGCWTIDDSACYYSKQIRSNPNYLITYTPFLNEILTSLTLSQRGLFDIFKPYGTLKQPYEEYDWPGVGNAGEESPVYDFNPSSKNSGRAEAGAKKPGDSQSYYYRYLGSLQCAKERVMQVLQPFISGESYKPFAYDCFPELAAATGPIVPATGQWLQWPCSGAYVEDDRLSVCYQDPRRPAHAGLDLQCPGGTIFPSAPGKVVAVNNNPGAHGFGIYVIIDHGNGWSTLYAHLDRAMVSVGKDVGLNTPIGIQDDTGAWSFGSHLHLGLSHGNNPHNFEISGPTADPCAAISGCSCSP